MSPLEAALARALKARFHAVYPDGASFDADAAAIVHVLAADPQISHGAGRGDERLRARPAVRRRRDGQSRLS